MVKADGGDSFRGRSRAEINFVRLAQACERESTLGIGDQADLEHVEQQWRRHEAYAVRMRELLDEIRTNNSQGVDAYARMLSSAATSADKARKVALKLEREKTSYRASPDSAPPGPSSVQALALAALCASPSSAPPPEPAPSLASRMEERSGADRRALLLGEGGGKEGVRHRGAGRRASGMGRGGEREVLVEDRRLQERLELELTGMTRALKGNVEAMHSTLMADNVRLDQIDTDIVKGQERLTAVNVKVDEQRMSNRQTTCLQCISILVVVCLFFVTFLTMQIFGKVPIRPMVAMPEITPNAGDVEGGTPLRMACQTGGAQIYYSIDGGERLLYSDERPPAVPQHAGKGRKAVKMRVSAVGRKVKMEESRQARATLSVVAKRGEGREGEGEVGGEKEMMREEKMRTWEEMRRAQEVDEARAEQQRTRTEADEEAARERERARRAEEEERMKTEKRADEERKEAERRAEEEEARARDERETQERITVAKRAEEERIAKERKEEERKEEGKKEEERKKEERKEEGRKEERRKEEEWTAKERKAEVEKKEAERRAEEEGLADEERAREERVAAVKRAEEEKIAKEREAEEARVVEAEEARVVEAEEARVVEAEEARVVEAEEARVVEAEEARVVEAEEARVVEAEEARVVEAEEARVVEAEEARVAHEQSAAEAAKREEQQNFAADRRAEEERMVKEREEAERHEAERKVSEKREEEERFAQDRLEEERKEEERKEDERKEEERRAEEERISTKQDESEAARLQEQQDKARTEKEAIAEAARLKEEEDMIEQKARAEAAKLGAVGSWDEPEEDAVGVKGAEEQPPAGPADHSEEASQPGRGEL